MLRHTNRSSERPKRVVILGANGFIGSAIANKLDSKSVPIVRVSSSECDLCAIGSAQYLIRLLEPDDTLVVVSAKAPCKTLEMLRINLSMVENICLALKETSVRHIVYVSSDAVYRDSRNLITERTCAEPSSIHGLMHLSRELALKHDYANQLAIVRPTLVYGLKDPHNGYGPNLFRRQAISGRDIILFGNGEELRDHVYVEDVADLINEIIFFRSIGTINAVSGGVVSFFELAQFISQCFKPIVAVRTQERKGPMPHDGYRAFDNRSVQEAFPQFRFKSWKEGLNLVNALSEKDKL